MATPRAHGLSLGAVASGKSTVATTLEELGAQTVNADLVGHKVYAPGTPCFVEIVRHFGSGIVGASGEIDRKALGQIVFHDTKQMHALNRIVWPAIRAELAQHIEQARAEGAPVLVIEAAVLIEAQWQDMVDEVWVTYVDPDVACTRLIARHSMSKKHAMQRIHSQIPNAERLQHADVAIDNNGSMEELRQQVQLAPCPFRAGRASLTHAWVARHRRGSTGASCYSACTRGRRGTSGVCVAWRPCS